MSDMGLGCVKTKRRCDGVFGLGRALLRGPLYPQEQTSPTGPVRSASCQEETHAPQQVLLFDHLFGTPKQRRRHRDPHRRPIGTTAHHMKTRRAAVGLGPMSELGQMRHSEAV